VLARVETQEWEWARAWTVALAQFVLAEGDDNRGVLTTWVHDWLPRALAAMAALAPLAQATGLDFDAAGDRVRAYAAELLADAGLPELCELVGHEPPAPVVERKPARVPTPSAEPAARSRPASETAAAASATSANGTYDYVGIVMAKSAEGDAVSHFLSRRADVEVIEQPSFWDIRARDRLVIPYDQISEELGYEIDAYSIQHEMSTHYGRMVATDDALMLFSDPTEAMEHLLS
jgi:propane monooxygenase coupling protein